MHVTFGGRYRLQVHHGDTDILLHDTGWFDNLITNNGLDLLGTGFTPSCYVSSNTAAPAETDTSIANILATSSTRSTYNNIYNNSGNPYYWAQQSSFTFAIGAVQGTIGQVAIGSSSSNLFSKAQLTEVGGSPTTLTLSGIDRLTLYYELRQYIRTTDLSHTIDINGSTYSCLNRALYPSGQGAWCPLLGVAIGQNVSGDGNAYRETAVYYGGTTPFIGTLTGAPSGTGVQSSSYSRSAYVAGTHARTVTSVWTTAKGAITNITAAVFGSTYSTLGNMGGQWQSSIEGATLSKTQYQNLALEWQFSWGRYP